ncbi:porin [Arcticibacter eurypsychrophilus]|uniref:porin n=1 Tax=Arcticibacter eurypsychrophilus TaxID=1434752 RepID=UPI00084D5A95|nr:porin [Arcticibacter eurypsychrophilus]
MRYSLLVLILSFALIKASKADSSMEPGDTTVQNYSNFKRSFQLSGLLQLRYTYSLTDSVNVNGSNYTGDGVNNSFALKRVRLMARANINDHFDASILLNLADFSGNPQNKVLENAFIRYHYNKHLNLQMGQFRPFFGPEDLLPVDIIKSLDYSNQYYLFGNSGWQSFQMGLAAYGDIVSKGTLPLRYYAGIYNGNGRNKAVDNDNGKDMYARLETDMSKKIRLGLNAAYGTSAKAEGSALGADFSMVVPLNSKLQLELLTEYKQGTNFAEYELNGLSTGTNISKYQNRGFYVFPNIRYDYKHPRLRSIEFSCRYEYLDENYKLEKNLRQTLTPMVSLEFTDDYFARLQLGCTVDIYDHDVPLTAQYSHTMAVAQLQVRF